MFAKLDTFANKKKASGESAACQKAGYGIFARCITLMLVFAMLAGLMAGCGSKLTDEELAVNDDKEIVLHGLTDEDITITVADLKELDAITKKAEAKRSNGQIVEVKITGPLLTSLVEKYGASLSDFNTVRFYGSDDYEIAMPSNILENDDIILGYYDYGEPISSSDGPVHVVVPGERAMYWVRKLCRIDFENEASATAAEKLVFMDTALWQLTSAEVTRGEDTFEGVKTADLIAAYADANDNTIYNVYMTASDGLSKNETKANFMSEYIRTMGDGAPEFTGPDLADGMTVNGLMTINYGTTGFISLDQYCASVEKESTDSILFSDILKVSGLAAADSYKFTDLSGNEKEYSYDSLSNAIVALDDAGNATFSPGNGEEMMTSLLSIEVVG